MIDFEIAVEWVIPREGGLSLNKNDAGGTTKYGISLRFLREVDVDMLRKCGIFEDVTEETIIDLTLDQAKALYRYVFWEAAPFDQLPSQRIANYVFDMAVNHGVNQAVKLLQRAICSAKLQKDYVLDDGVMGPKTLLAASDTQYALPACMIAVRQGFYRQLAAIRPKDLEFLDGWLNRCFDF